MTDERSSFVPGIAISIVLIALALVLFAWIGDADATSDRNSEDVRSFCDEHGHRVYVSEDDVQSSPAIFVLPDDCAGTS